jgi:hypothetical protein
MNLTLKEKYWLKFCKKLIRVISHDNYYNQFNALLVNGIIIDSFRFRQFFFIPNGVNQFGSQTVMFHLLLASVLPEFDRSLAINTFSSLR